MNLIAIDCSTPQASVALWANEVLFERIEVTQKNHATVILPLLQTLLDAASVSMSEISGIVFGCGPGSFTGLRIACGLAKGLAFSHDLPLYPVSSLFNMAYQIHSQAMSSIMPVLSLIDAHMQEVYWRYSHGEMDIQKEYVTPISDITIPAMNPLWLVHANVAQSILEKLPVFIQERIQKTVLCMPSAAMMIQAVLKGGILPVSAEAASPVYIRNKVTHG